MVRVVDNEKRERERGRLRTVVLFLNPFTRKKERE